MRGGDTFANHLLFDDDVRGDLSDDGRIHWPLAKTRPRRFPA
jgi:hypothetical protein